MSPEHFAGGGGGLGDGREAAGTTYSRTAGLVAGVRRRRGGGGALTVLGFPVEWGKERAARERRGASTGGNRKTFRCITWRWHELVNIGQSQLLQIGSGPKCQLRTLYMLSGQLWESSFEDLGCSAQLLAQILGSWLRESYRTRPKTHIIPN